MTPLPWSRTTTSTMSPTAPTVTSMGAADELYFAAFESRLNTISRAAVGSARTDGAPETVTASMSRAIPSRPRRRLARSALRRIISRMSRSASETSSPCLTRAVLAAVCTIAMGVRS